MFTTSSDYTILKGKKEEQKEGEREKKVDGTEKRNEDKRRKQNRKRGEISRKFKYL